MIDMKPIDWVQVTAADSWPCEWEGVDENGQPIYLYSVAVEEK